MVGKGCPSGGEGRRCGIGVDDAEEEDGVAPGGSVGVRKEEGELKMHRSEEEPRGTVEVVKAHQRSWQGSMRRGSMTSGLTASREKVAVLWAILWE